jgi:hypothetical protein
MIRRSVEGKDTTEKTSDADILRHRAMIVATAARNMQEAFHRQFASIQTTAIGEVATGPYPAADEVSAVS